MGNIGIPSSSPLLILLTLPGILIAPDAGMTPGATAVQPDHVITEDAAVTRAAPTLRPRPQRSARWCGWRGQPDDINDLEKEEVGPGLGGDSTHW